MVSFIHAGMLWMALQIFMWISCSGAVRRCMSVEGSRDASSSTGEQLTPPQLYEVATDPINTTRCPLWRTPEGLRYTQPPHPAPYAYEEQRAPLPPPLQSWERLVSVLMSGSAECSEQHDNPTGSLHEATITMDSGTVGTHRPLRPVDVYQDPGRQEPDGEMPASKRRLAACAHSLTRALMLTKDNQYVVVMQETSEQAEIQRRRGVTSPAVTEDRSNQSNACQTLRQLSNTMLQNCSQAVDAAREIYCHQSSTRELMWPCSNSFAAYALPRVSWPQRVSTWKARSCRREHTLSCMLGTGNLTSTASEQNPLARIATLIAVASFQTVAPRPATAESSVRLEPASMTGPAPKELTRCSTQAPAASAPAFHSRGQVVSTPKHVRHSGSSGWSQIVMQTIQDGLRRLKPLTNSHADVLFTDLIWPRLNSITRHTEVRATANCLPRGISRSKKADHVCDHTALQTADHTARRDCSVHLTCAMHWLCTHFTGFADSAPFRRQSTLGQGSFSRIIMSEAPCTPCVTCGWRPCRCTSLEEALHSMLPGEHHERQTSGGSGDSSASMMCIYCLEQPCVCMQTAAVPIVVPKSTRTEGEDDTAHFLEEPIEVVNAQESEREGGLRTQDHQPVEHDASTKKVNTTWLRFLDVAQNDQEASLLRALPEPSLEVSDLARASFFLEQIRQLPDPLKSRLVNKIEEQHSDLLREPRGVDLVARFEAQRLETATIGTTAGHEMPTPTTPVTGPEGNAASAPFTTETTDLDEFLAGFAGTSETEDNSAILQDMGEPFADSGAASGQIASTPDVQSEESEGDGPRCSNRPPTRAYESACERTVLMCTAYKSARACNTGAYRAARYSAQATHSQHEKRVATGKVDSTPSRTLKRGESHPVYAIHSKPHACADRHQIDAVNRQELISDYNRAYVSASKIGLFTKDHSCACACAATIWYAIKKYTTPQPIRIHARPPPAQADKSTRRRNDPIDTGNVVSTPSRALNCLAKLLVCILTYTHAEHEISHRIGAHFGSYPSLPPTIRLALTEPQPPRLPLLTPDLGLRTCTEDYVQETELEIGQDTHSVTMNSDHITTGFQGTAPGILVLTPANVPACNMGPSPSSKKKSSRRLPTRLRQSGAEPTGKLLALRQAAVAKAQKRQRSTADSALQEVTQQDEPGEEPSSSSRVRFHPKRRKKASSEDMVEMDYIIELSEPEEDTEQDTVPTPVHNRNLTADSAQVVRSRRQREDLPKPASGERPTASKRGEPPRPPLARRRKTAISKALTDVLRHSGARQGLEVRADALFELRAVLDTHKLKALHAQEHEILQVVEESDKKRFEVVQREGAKWIRAAQGHSMEGIDNSTFQVRVPRRLLPQELYHGTYDDAYSQIVQSGLLAGGPSRKRNDIHLTEGLPTDRPISGMRNTCNIALAILPKEAAAEGCTFYKSGNQVYLTKGIGTQKVLPARFIHAVIILKSGERILPRTADGPPSLRDVHAGLLRANEGMRAPRRKTKARALCAGHVSRHSYKLGYMWSSQATLHTLRSKHDYYACMLPAAQANRAKINAGSLIPRHTATEPRCIPVHGVHLSKWMSPAKLLCKAAMPETTTSLLLSMVGISVRVRCSACQEKLMHIHRANIPEGPQDITLIKQIQYLSRRHCCIIQTLIPSPATALVSQRQSTYPYRPHLTHEWTLLVNASIQTAMPSPSSQKRSARRLPSRLRETGAEPTGHLQTLREEAVERARNRQVQQQDGGDERDWWHTWSWWSPHSQEWQWQTSDGARATDGDAQGWGVNVMDTQAETRRTQSMEGLLNELATGVAASSRRKEAKRSTSTSTTRETYRLDLRETTNQEAEHPSSSFQVGSDSASSNAPVGGVRYPASGKVSGLHTSPESNSTSGLTLTTIQKIEEPPLDHDSPDIGPMKAPAASSRCSDEQETRQRSSAARRSSTIEPRPEERTRSSAARRASTIEPRPHLLLVQAPLKVREVKHRLLRDAKSAVLKLIPHGDDLHTFLNGYFRRHHATYHANPVNMPSCGNWIWSLTAALMTRPESHPNVWRRSHAGKLGDAVEGYLYTLYQSQTAENLALLATYGEAAKSLHDLMQGIPHAIYYRLCWRQSLDSLAELLEPWIGAASTQDMRSSHPVLTLAILDRNESTAVTVEEENTGLDKQQTTNKREERHGPHGKDGSGGTLSTDLIEGANPSNSGEAVGLHTSPVVGLAPEPILTTLKKPAEPPLALDLLVAPQTQMPAASSQGLGEQEANQRSTAARRSNTNEPRPEARQRSSAARRASTVEPRPHLLLAQAPEEVRHAKQRLLQEAKSAVVKLIPHGDDLHNFLHGYFRQHHATYHTSPMNMPSCGNWIWSLTAALMTRPESHPNVWTRRQAGKLGDAVEGYLYTLYQKQTVESLALLAIYGEAARHLHDLMQGIPHAIYYRLSWRQSLDTLEELLEPWIGVSDAQDKRSPRPAVPLSILDSKKGPCNQLATQTAACTHVTSNARSCLGRRGRKWRLRPTVRRRHLRGRRRRNCTSYPLQKLFKLAKKAQHIRNLLQQHTNKISSLSTWQSTSAKKPKPRRKIPEKTSTATPGLSLPGPKSGLYALIWMTHRITRVGGVRVPVSHGAGGPTTTDRHFPASLVGKQVAGETTAPVFGAAGVTTQVGRKRSFQRAQHQSTQNPLGYTRYRGRFMHCSQLGLHTATMPSLTTAKPRRPPCRPRGGAQQRLKVLSINVNSLSGFLWGEVKAFLGGEGMQYDFIFLQETHRTAFCAFKVDNWMAVGSSTKRGEDVLTLVHPRYDASMVRYQEIIPGRVLRVKVCHKEAAIETLNIYQHVWIHTDDPEQNKQRRQTLLDKCTATIQGMARRDTLILAGDFNSEVHAVNGLIGTRVNRSAYHQALDPLSLPRFIQDNALVALNTWHMKDPCTNYTRTGNSQIDYILVRAPSADTRAKQVVKQEAPFGAWKELTHSALIADVRIIKHFHLPKAKMQQELQYSRHDLDYAYRQKDHRITQLKSKVELEINHSLNHGLPLTADHINHTLLREVSDLFPTATSAHTNRGHAKAQCKAIFAAWKELLTHPDEVGGSTITLPARVYHMWQRRRDLQRCKPFTLSGVLRTWQWVLLFNKAGRQSKQYHLQHQRAIARGHLQQAERAAQTHNTKRLYGAVKRLLPWKPKPRIMLKHPDGSPMSLHQEHQALVQHCKQLFAPPAASPNRPGQMLSMPLTAGEWTTQLKCTPIGKAVPADSAPATAWKACATIVAPAMACVAKRLQPVTSALPDAWKNPQLCFLPKPHKPPSTAAALRPIGLLRPDGKAFAGYIKNQLLMQACSSLTHTPQYAYLPARDTSDALARVNACIHDIKDGLKALGGNRFLTRQRKETGQVKGESGGCLLSVDLSQAFDRVNRAKLDRALALHQVDADLRSTVTAIHEQAAYQVRDKFHRTDICTTQGIRQGCRLAPALWAVLSSQLLWDLTPAGQTPLQLPFTLFADDHL